MPRKATPFVSKTYELLSDEQLNDIIHWSASNDSFIIAKPLLFENDILPKYFKHSKLNSFIRQLNTYGFKKIVKKDSKDLEFKHKLFVKGNETLLPFIVRRSNTSKQVAKIEEEAYSNLKKCVEGQEYVKKLMDANEKMTNEIIAVRKLQLKTEQELINVKKELMQAQDTLRRFSSQAQLFYPNFYNSGLPQNDPSYSYDHTTTFVDFLLKGDMEKQSNAVDINDLTSFQDQQNLVHSSVNCSPC